MKAFALVSVLLLSTLLLLLSSSFVAISVSDLKISKSQETGLQAYYWAEAGINKALWEIDNNADWMDKFVTGNLNQELLGEYFSAQLTSTEPGKAEITATGIKNNAQRIVKTKIFKALGNSFPEDLTMLSDEDILFSYSQANIDEGSLLANDDLFLIINSNVQVDNKAAAGDDIIISWSSTLNAGEQEENASTLELPMLDFELYKEQAEVYSSQEFKDLLSNDPDAVLNGIIYVTGEIHIKNGQNPVINGLLLSDDHIKVGYKTNSGITINNIPGEPSGLVAKKKIFMGNSSNNINIQGLIYSNDRFLLSHFSPGLTFNLEGGIIAPKVEFWTLNHLINIKHNPEIIQSALGSSAGSPIIDIEHWEEEY